MFIEKKSTAPNSASVSIATKESPATMAGRAAGNIIEYNVLNFVNPKICIYDLDGTIIDSSHRAKYSDDGILDLEHWKENSTKSTLDFLKEVNNYGVSRLIFTDIEKDGTKESPNFAETSKVASISNCPVIISGGVSSINDVIKARNMENIEGIIVGKAIYDGDIKLEELVKEDA